MKKEIFVLALILIFLPTIFALELKLSKESYFQGETLQGELTGNFISLKLDNFRLYRQDSPRPIPVLSGLKNYDNIYFFYTVLPIQTGNYSLRIEGARYTELGETKEEAIIKDFTITKTNQSYLSFNPGFIEATDEISLNIKSLNKNSEITATLELTGVVKNYSLIEDVDKTILFSSKNMINGRTTLIIGQYQIPVFISGQVDNITTISGKPSLIFEPDSLSGTIKPGNNYFFKLILLNNGNSTLTNINLSSNLNLSISPNKIDALSGNDYFIINLTLIVPSNQKQNISGELLLSVGVDKLSLPISFILTTDSTQVNLTGTTIEENLSCLSIGKICAIEEDCIGKTTKSLDGACCIGDCIKRKDTNPRVFIGIIIIAIVALGVFWFLKTRSKVPPKSPEDILRERTKSYRDRSLPPPPSKGNEVNGNLGKV